MIDDKVCLMVMVTCLDSPLVIQNILEVLVDLSLGLHPNTHENKWNEI